MVGVGGWGWRVELGEAVGVARVCLLFGDVVRGETEVVWHTENGGGTCVEEETEYRVPRTVVSGKDEGGEEEKKEVGDGGENVETGVGVGKRCR